MRYIKSSIFQPYYIFFLFPLFFFARNPGADTKIGNDTTDSLTEEQKRLLMTSNKYSKGQFMLAFRRMATC